MSNFDPIKATDAVFELARQAGLEDGVDFTVSQGPAGTSPRFKAWLRANQSCVFLHAFNQSHQS